MGMLGRFARLRPADRTLLVEACLLLAAIRAALWLLPWRRVLAFAHAMPARSSPRFAVDRLEWAVLRAGRVVPRATCLAQAVTLGRLLAREGYAGSIQIGVTNAPRFEAHAWVEHDGTTLLDDAGQLARYSRLISWTLPRPDALP